MIKSKSIAFAGLFLVLSVIAYAQPSQNRADRKNQERANVLFAETEQYFKDVPTSLPEKEEGNSALVLKEFSLHEFTVQSSSRTNRSTFRYMVKLLDKAAIEHYSEFSFSSYVKSGYRFKSSLTLGLNIKKQDGTVHTVDLQEAVDVEGEERKIAVSNLEVGDILDVVVSTELIQVNRYFCFDPEFSILSGRYPIVEGESIFMVDRGYFVNFQSLNGAPPLTKNESLSDRKNLVYEIKYKDLEGRGDAPYVGGLRYYPSIKFQVCYYSIPQAQKSDYFLGSPYEIKNKTERQEIERVMASLIEGPHFSKDKLFFKHVKKYFPQGLSKDKTVELAHNFLKYNTLIWSEHYGRYETEVLNKRVNQMYFVKEMKRYLDGFDIENEFVAVTSRYISNLDEVIFPYELDYLLRYKKENGSWDYLFAPRIYDDITMSMPRNEGQKGLAYNGKTYTEVTIPVKTHQENIIKVNFGITPDFNTNHTNLTLDTEVNGSFKDDYGNNVLSWTPYRQMAHIAIYPEDQDLERISRPEKQAMESDKEDQAKNHEKKLDQVTEMRKNSFEIEKYENFEIKKFGIGNDHPFHFTEEIKVKDAISKMGPNYVLDIGKICFDQMEVKEKHRERDADIFIDYCSTYDYTFEVEIPSGYKVEGLDALNTAVDNDFGSFSLVASEENGKAVIHMVKSYKKIFIEQENWNSMLEFLDPAAKMNDAKLIFKPAA